jgi:hypothetical protein
MHGDEMNPKLRTALTHLGTAGGAALATAMFLATKGVDLYAIIDQLNVVVAEVTKLVALVTPIATAAYGVWRATTKNKLQDIEADPRVKGVITTAGLAAELGPKVQPSVSELPASARAA